LSIFVVHRLLNPKFLSIYHCKVYKLLFVQDMFVVIGEHLKFLNSSVTAFLDLKLGHQY